MFFTFNQNNSGGHFTRNANVDHYVIVEATHWADASQRAQNLGIYFNGVNEGNDCECCGDRWYESNNGTDVPSSYGSPFTLANASDKKNPREHTVVIHYLDGRVVYTTSDYENENLNNWRDLALMNEDESEQDY
jgi:hypothetical protein